MKKTGLWLLVLVCALSVLPSASLGAQLAGVTLEDQITIGDRTATLSGMGIRTKTFLKVKVYVAGLYLEAPSRDPREIIASDLAKAMVMKFLYKEVEGEKLKESWRSGFEANTPGASPDLQGRMDLFISLFTAPALKGDEYLLAYEPGRGTTVSLKGEVKATIPGADFASALMAVWLGEDLADGGLKSLKKDLLGGMGK